MAIIQRFKTTLNANASRNIPFFGNYIRVISCDSKIRVETGKDTLVLNAGDWARVDLFDNLYVTNLGAVFNELELVLSNGADYGRDASIVSGTIAVESVSGSGQEFKTITAIVSGAEVLNFDGDRIYYLIINNSGGDIKIGNRDLLQDDKHIVVKNGETYSDEHAPINPVYISGNGSVSIVAKYKTARGIALPSDLVDGEGDTLIDGEGNTLASY